MGLFKKIGRAAKRITKPIGKAIKASGGVTGLIAPGLNKGIVGKATRAVATAGAATAVSPIANKINEKQKGFRFSLKEQTGIGVADLFPSSNTSSGTPNQDGNNSNKIVIGLGALAVLLVGLIALRK